MSLRRININKSYMKYTDSVEQIQPSEQEVFAEIAATMRDLVTKIGARQRHVVRFTPKVTDF